MYQRLVSFSKCIIFFNQRISKNDIELGINIGIFLHKNKYQKTIYKHRMLVLPVKMLQFVSFRMVLERLTSVNM